MQKYRKKPVIITAWKTPDYYEDPTDELVELVSSQGWEYDTGGITIPTLEGDQLCSPGDYIIQGVQGEYYPCKPDIFETTYEPV